MHFQRRVATPANKQTNKTAGQ